MHNIQKPRFHETPPVVAWSTMSEIPCRLEPMTNCLSGKLRHRGVRLLLEEYTVRPEMESGRK